MKPMIVLTNLAAFIALTASSDAINTGSQLEPGPESFRWIKGPTKVALRDMASLEIPAGYFFLDGAQAKTLLERRGNPPSGDEAGVIAMDSHDWTVVVEARAVGYVSDNGWENLDSDSILKLIRMTNQLANAQRVRNGRATIRVRDWDSPPIYDPVAHCIEWAVRAESEGSTVVNRVVGMLGRKGVVQFVLVDQHEAPSAVVALKELVCGFAFHPGERYADARPGDRPALGGLAAIVTGSNAPDSAESTPVPEVRTERERFASTGELAALLAIFAALTGFVIGRKFDRKRRIQRSRGHPSAPGSVDCIRRSPEPSSIGRPPRSIGEAGAAGAKAPGSQGPMQLERSPELIRTRRRRCDACSFYERLTRDLHWTIGR